MFPLRVAHDRFFPRGSGEKLARTTGCAETPRAALVSGDKPAQVNTMGDDEQRWRFYDFGVTQYVWDTTTGDTYKTFGRSSLFANQGPFTFELCGGRPKVVPLEGGGSCHYLDVHSNWIVRVMATDGLRQTLLQRKGCGEKPAAWMEDLQPQRVSKALVIPLPGGFKSFKGCFFWYDVPSDCSGIHISVRLEFSWLVEYIFGTNRAGECHKYAKKLRDELHNLHGWSEGHVLESSKSQKRKRPGEDRARQLDSVQGEPSWAVSMVAVFHFLSMLYCNQKWKLPCGRDCIKALLQTLLLWPLGDDRSIAFSSTRGGCDTFLTGTTVDYRILDESEITSAAERGETTATMGRRIKRTIGSSLCSKCPVIACCLRHFTR